MGASEVPLKFSVHKMIVDVIVGEVLIDPLEEQSLTSAMKLFTKSVVGYLFQLYRSFILSIYV